MAFGFFTSLIQKFTGRPVDWEELEEALIRADLGVPMMSRILKECQAREEKLTAESVVKVAHDEILKVLPRDNPVLRPLATKTKVILVVGVNGTGKTTSTAKLAHFLKKKGHTVLLAAADTFRAAAIEQLDVWAGRIGCDIVKGEYKEWAPFILRQVNVKDFPLRAVTAMPIDNECVFYSDRDRWTNRED